MREEIQKTKIVISKVHLVGSSCLSSGVWVSNFEFLPSVPATVAESTECTVVGPHTPVRKDASTDTEGMRVRCV